ncbi:MAG: hypothetical protein CSB48_07220 [Proteobacteria bacterium]|nr:MAG: hypothetical protein CSB48_07220 [Pseudomonadota bacterium]PIE40168.1 MAG: hypothetical protein CSA51_02035 [Gammaproteobacteria bacterium]
MSDKDKDINRILMQFEHIMRQGNRERINPLIEELAIDDLKPIIDLVARTRASYLKHLHDLCNKYYGSDDLPSAEEFKRLRAYRKRFVELADGAKSFEISIQRGYLDIKS